MEIITPQQLWESYDRSTPPNTTVISEGNAEKKLYFNGYSLDGSVVRIYARLALPSGKTDQNKSQDNSEGLNHNLPNTSKKPSVIILLSSAFEDIDKVDPSFFTDKGFAVLMVDYFGNHKDKQHFTIYPKTIDAFWETDPSLLTLPPADIKTSCWYYFTTCALHAVTFLQQCDLIDADRIGIVGTDEGASLVFKASFCSAIKAGITFFSGDLTGSGEQYLAYKASLDSRSYAKGSFPILINAATNEITNSFDYLNELYTVCPNTCFCVFPAAKRAIGENQRLNVKAWFDSAFDGISVIKDKPALNAPVLDGLNAASLRPTISVFGSEGAIYAEISSCSTDITVFYAEDAAAAFRNWKKTIPSKVAENKYLCKLDISNPEKAIHVFANITFSGGFTLSSAVLTKSPLKLGFLPFAPACSRLIYQSEDKTEGFLTVGDGINAYPPVMTKGPFDIEGVKGDLLISFKLGDIRFCGRPESLLQLMLSTDQAQEIEISLIEKENGIKYKAVKKITGGVWTTVTLSSQDFKSNKGVLSFDRIVGIKIKGEGIILNSMLWV